MSPKWRDLFARRPRPPAPGPAPSSEQAQVFHAPPPVLLTAQQRQVWAVVSTWCRAEPHPGRLRRMLIEMCRPQPDGNGLRRPPDGALNVHAFAFDGGALRCGPEPQAPVEADVPPFLLLLSDDPPAPGAEPSLHVLTRDLGAQVVLWPAPARGELHVAILWSTPDDVERPQSSLDTQGLTYVCEGDEGVDFVCQALATPRPAPPAAPGQPSEPWPSPGPSPSPFPADAAPGQPPPPLPGTTPLRADAARNVGGWYGPGQPVDHPLSSLAATLQSTDARPWAARLVAALPAEWAAVRILRLRPGPRTVEVDGRPALLEEDGVCQLVAALLDVRSLPAAGILHPPLSRLRMLHERLLPVSPGVPASARWSALLGRPAVLDLFADPVAQVPSGFSVACDTAAPSGAQEAEPRLLATVVGVAPAYRAQVVDHAEAVAAHLVQPPGPPAEVPPTWLAPPGWTATEELQLTTENWLVTVRLVPLREGATLDDWEAQEFRRAPFLRDLRHLGQREVTVDGLDAPARFHRFDWQPSAGVRTLTTACFGVAAGNPGEPPSGFSMIADVPLAQEDASLQPDEVLRWLRVLRT